MYEKRRGAMEEALSRHARLRARELDLPGALEAVAALDGDHRVTHRASAQ